MPCCGAISACGFAFLLAAYSSAREERHAPGEVLEVRDHDLTRRIDGHAAPVHPAGVAGKHQSALEGGRRVHALEAQRLELLPTRGPVPGRQAPGIARGEREVRERLGLHREGLGGREALSRHVDLRHGAFADREERLARLPVQDEQEAHLGGLHERGNRATVAPQVEEGGLRGDVEVPQVVVDGLEAPHDLAGRAAERHHGAPVVRERRITVEVVGRRVAGRDEDQVSLHVHRHRRPHVGRAQHVARRARVLGAALEVRRCQVPGPAERTRANVEAAHDAARSVDPLIVGDRRPHHDDVPRDDGRRRHLVLAAPLLLPDARVEVDLPRLPEIGAGAPGGGVQRDQPRVVGPGQDAPSTLPLPTRVRDRARSRRRGR